MRKLDKADADLTLVVFESSILQRTLSFWLSGSGTHPVVCLDEHREDRTADLITYDTPTEALNAAIQAVVNCGHDATVLYLSPAWAEVAAARDDWDDLWMFTQVTFAGSVCPRPLIRVTAGQTDLAAGWYIVRGEGPQRHLQGPSAHWAIAAVHAQAMVAFVVDDRTV